MRYAAWLVLRIWFIAGCITAGIWMARYQARQAESGPGTSIVVEQGYQLSTPGSKVAIVIFK